MLCTIVHIVCICIYFDAFFTVFLSSVTLPSRSHHRPTQYITFPFTYAVLTLFFSVFLISSLRSLSNRILYLFISLFSVETNFFLVWFSGSIRTTRSSQCSHRSHNINSKWMYSVLFYVVHDFVLFFLFSLKCCFLHFVLLFCSICMSIDLD